MILFSGPLLQKIDVRCRECEIYTVYFCAVFSVIILAMPRGNIQFISMNRLSGSMHVCVREYQRKYLV
jgi:hypothetical protein